MTINRSVRISILLFILLLVGMDALLSRWRSIDWDQSLTAVVYPINGDSSIESAKYIRYITQDDFKPVENYIQSEAKRYNVNLADPVIIKLAPELHQNPPSPPENGNYLKAVWWSLKMRYWAYKYDTFDETATIRIFVRYHNFEENKRIGHSVGLEKGKVCVVNAYANPRLLDRNQVIITHEILHTLGATDKYDFVTEMPIYPEGYAAPDQNPLFPQRQGEIMGGYIPLAQNKTEMPASLAETVVGRKTASEIGWRD